MSTLTDRAAPRLALVALAMAAGCSLLLPTRGRPEADGGPDADDGGVDADGDTPDGGDDDADTAHFVDADTDTDEAPLDGDLSDGATEDAEVTECATEETCSECVDDTCLGACEDEDCDGFSLACPGSDEGDERMSVAPERVPAGGAATVQICTENHRHGCVFVRCQPPEAAEPTIRLTHATTTSSGDTVCWTFRAADDTALPTAGLWTCTFFSKIGVDESCVGGTTLAQACAVVDVLP